VHFQCGPLFNTKSLLNYTKHSNETKNNALSIMNLQVHKCVCAGRHWSMVLHTNIHYTPTLICHKLSFLLSFLPLQQHITIFQKYLDSDSDKTQVLTSLDMKCTILGLISAMLRSQPQPNSMQECALCWILCLHFRYRMHFTQFIFHRYSNSTPAHSREISDNICFSPVYYPIRAC